MNHFWLPEVASAHGGQIDHVILLTHYLMAILFVGWSAYFIYTLIRFRQSKNPKADFRGVTGSFSTYVEVGVVIAEIVLLVGFSIPLWAKLVVELPDPKNATEIRVVGEQFVWNIHYPGLDGKFGKTKPDLVDAASNPLGLDSSDPNSKDDLTTVNQMHVPLGKPVLVYITSKDVIHSFSLTEMRVKHDAIPGMSLPVTFTPIKIGNWEIACAQLCGLGHYRMRGYLTVETQETFNAWMKSQLETKTTSDEAGDSFFD